MPENKYDVAVIGAGPGGYTAAFRASDLGLSVALIDSNPTLGGVCLNVGCIPSKALLHMAFVLEEAKAVQKHGISFGEPSINIKKIVSYKDSVIKQLTNGLALLSRQRKVEIFNGTAAFHDNTTLLVDGKTKINFKHCIIATGSRNTEIKGWPKHDAILDSSTVLNPTEIPKKMLIVGGGIIGLEMATVYSSFGTKVTIVEYLPALLPTVDPEITKPLIKALSNNGVTFHLGAVAKSAKVVQDKIEVELDIKNKLTKSIFDKVLVSIGRTPNSNKLGLDAIKLNTNKRGFIPSNDQLQTAVPNIFSIGDVRGQPMLAHKATHEAKVAAEVIAGHKSYLDIRTIPSVAYTNPEIAWMGYTETTAKQENIPYQAYSFPWQASGRALASNASGGLTKILVNPENQRIIGCQITGLNAGELIAEATLALEMGADIEDIAHTVHAHPTLSETFALAAETAAGTITDLYYPKKKIK